MKLPKSVSELCVIEKIEVKNLSYPNEGDKNMISVSAKDGREYLIFDKEETATMIAEQTFVETFDDEVALSQMKIFNRTLEVYARDMVFKNGVSYYMSYDQHNKISLTGKAIAYRTI